MVLTTSTVPSSLVISIVTFVSTAVNTPIPISAGYINPNIPAAIPALTGISTTTVSSFLIFTLVTLPFLKTSFTHAINSSFVVYISSMLNLEALLCFASI